MSSNPSRFSFFAIGGGALGGAQDDDGASEYSSSGRLGSSGSASSSGSILSTLLTNEELESQTDDLAAQVRGLLHFVEMDDAAIFVLNALVNSGVMSGV